jgi:hypothetical protein
MLLAVARVIVVCFIIAFTFHSHSALSQVDFSAAIERVSRSVVVIRGNNGLGSGFIVSPDGKIATNLHVIQNMIQASVQLSNGEIFDSFTVVGVDVRRDLAVIKVAGFNLPAVELGDSQSIRVGEPVAIVGSPRGLSGTVTAGVLSAIRPIDGQTILQIDAAVNPGNSGGPMVKLNGSVVGVVVARLKNAENLNFAVPINSLRGLLENLAAPITLVQLRESIKGQNELFPTRQTTFAREWKSLQSSASRRLSIASDTITGENHLSAEQVKLGYSRWDIKRDGDRWLGKFHHGRACQTPATLLSKPEIKSCRFAWDVELSLVTPNRIEGKVIVPPPMAKFDCAACSFNPEPEFEMFVWVPAD